MRGNDRKESGNDRKRNLLVVAPTSSGKTFIGEIAAITQAIHKKKAIYLVPLRSLAEEKYHHFKDLYADCDINTLISSRDRREDDKKIIQGDYQVAVMVYEKFNYFLLKYPNFLREVSLIIIDEMQMINDPVRGPLLEEIIAYIRKQKPELKLIALSAFLDNEAGFLNWISANSLLSYQRPVELRKGLVREGTFKYITHNNCYCGEETFFAPDEVRDNCYEDYLRKTVSYFVKKDEPTLLFFPTRKDTRSTSKYVSHNGDYRNGYLTSMSMVDVENMGRRAGRLNQKEKEDFGRVIFLAHSLISETVVQNLYFNALKPANPAGMPRVNDPG